METKEIGLNWLGSCDVSNIQEFFSQHKDKGGVYFWIFKGNLECIACIGEAKNFKSRFETHFSNSLHGLYTAFGCEKGENLLSYYCNVSEGNYDKFYTPKKTTFSNLDEQADEIIRGVKMNLSFLKNMRFVFAEMQEDDPSLRKEVETIFMQKAREKYKAFKCSYWRSNANFWGVISKNLEEDAKYIIYSKGLLDKLLQEDLGLTETMEYYSGENKNES